MSELKHKHKITAWVTRGNSYKVDLELETTALTEEEIDLYELHMAALECIYLAERDGKKVESTIVDEVEKFEITATFTEVPSLRHTIGDKH